MQTLGNAFGGQRGPGNFTILRADKFILSNGVLTPLSFPLYMPDSLVSAPNLSFSSSTLSGLSHTGNVVTLGSTDDFKNVNIAATGTNSTVTVQATGDNSEVLLDADGSNSKISLIADGSGGYIEINSTDYVQMETPQIRLCNSNRVSHTTVIADGGTTLGTPYTAFNILDQGVVTRDPTANAADGLPSGSDIINALQNPEVGDTFMFTIVNLSNFTIDINSAVGMVPFDPNAVTIPAHRAAAVWFTIANVMTPLVNYWLVV